MPNLKIAGLLQTDAGSNKADQSQPNTNFPKVETGQTVHIQGWVRTRRDSKGGFSFLEINDGSCLANIQVIADAKLENYESVVKRLYAGSSVKVEGELRASQGGKQKVEVQARSVELVGDCPPEDYTIGKQRVSFEVLREMPHLRTRTNTFGAVTRVRNALANLIHRFFQEQGFYYIHTPIITGNDCEGAGELFHVTHFDPATINAGGKNTDAKTADAKNTGATTYDAGEDFFKQPAHLTVSGQLELEAYACSLGDVYSFGPTFRAENSHTSRHLAEFWMVEPEMAFAELEKNMELATRFLKYLFENILKQCPEDMDFFNTRIEKGIIQTLEHIAQSDFQHVTYTEAVDLLGKTQKKFEYPVSWGHDLQSEHERYLTEEVFKTPVIVTDYPESLKAFYMKINDDGKTVRAMDVLMPKIGEIIGGAQREERYDVLKERMEAKGIPEEGLSWYLDLRKFGSVPHAGFGLGFERLVQFVTGMTNIRDVIPYPRAAGHLGM